MYSSQFFRLFTIFSFVIFTIFLQSCSSKLRYVKKTTPPPPTLEERFDKAWLANDYTTATQLLNSGLELTHKVKGQSLTYLASLCVDTNFSQAVINKTGFVGEFKNTIDPIFKTAIATNNKEVIAKYLSCGYSTSNHIDSESLAYWAGFYVRPNLAGSFDSNGTFSDDYKRGFVKGHESRINSALAYIMTFHFTGHIFEGGNPLSAAWNEGSSALRSQAISAFYQELNPDFDSLQLKGLTIVTSLILDKKLTLDNLNEKAARALIQEELNRQSPGMGTLSNFVYGTIKRMNAVK